MKGKLYYIIVSVVTVLICFTGCTEDSSTQSRSDKKVFEDTESSAAQTEVTTTLTPLQTFTRFTAFDEKSDEAQTEKAQLVEKKTSETAVQTDRSEWFEKNKLFDMEFSDDTFSDEETTWYDFSEYDEEETQMTTSAVKTDESAVTTAVDLLVKE